MPFSGACIQAKPAFLIRLDAAGERDESKVAADLQGQ